MWNAEKPILLASQSAARRRLLEAAGIPVETFAHGVDEVEIRQTAIANQTPSDEIAITLAVKKACSVSDIMPDRWVVGGDQLLICEGVVYSKPSNRQEAAEHLNRLRGREHCLPTAVVLARHGKVQWSYCATPRLRMRSFSDGFLAAYLEEMGEGAYATVGGYKLEGLGIQLFEDIDGDVFTILGLPLLSLIGELRQCEVLAQ